MIHCYCISIHTAVVMMLYSLSLSLCDAALLLLQRNLHHVMRWDEMSNAMISTCGGSLPMSSQLVCKSLSMIESLYLILVLGMLLLPHVCVCNNGIVMKSTLVNHSVVL